jgi:hypothetical protein
LPIAPQVISHVPPPHSRLSPAQPRVQTRLQALASGHFTVASTQLRALEEAALAGTCTTAVDEAGPPDAPAGADGRAWTAHGNGVQPAGRGTSATVTLPERTARRAVWKQRIHGNASDANVLRTGVPIDRKILRIGGDDDTPVSIAGQRRTVSGCLNRPLRKSSLGRETRDADLIDATNHRAHVRGRTLCNVVAGSRTPVPPRAGGASRITAAHRTCPRVTRENTKRPAANIAFEALALRVARLADEELVGPGALASPRERDPRKGNDARHDASPLRHVHEDTRGSHAVSRPTRRWSLDREVVWFREQRDADASSG